MYKSLTLPALTIAVAAASLLASCKQESKEIKTKKGSIITIVDGKKDADRTKSKVGNIVTLHLTYRNAKDSVFFTSHSDGKPATGKIMADSLVDPIAGSFGYLEEGDSAMIQIPTDSLFKGQMAMQRPPFLPAGSMLKLGVKVLHMETPEKLNQRKTKEIEKYVADHNDMSYEKRPSGVLVAVTEKGAGKAAIPGDTLSVHYRGHMLNETTIFDESYLKGIPYTFVLKYGNAIQGWHDGLEGLPQGTKVNLIVPYALGYGESGSPEIPPYSTLQFDCEIVKVAPNKSGAPAAPLVP